MSFLREEKQNHNNYRFQVVVLLFGGRKTIKRGGKLEKVVEMLTQK